MKRSAFFRIVVFLPLFLISSCSTLGNPVLKTFGHVLNFGEGDAVRKFDPNYRYLRLVVDGRVTFLASSGRESDPVELWYSPTDEVLKMKNGRVVGDTGVFVEWRHVVLPDFPSWERLAQEKSYRWTRIRDVMPGYQYGIRDELFLHVVPPPERSALLGLDPKSLTWFEEDDLSKIDPLPPAFYALDPKQNRVVYGVVCLAKELCFSWQRWPADGKGGT